MAELTYDEMIADAKARDPVRGAFMGALSAQLTPENRERMPGFMAEITHKAREALQGAVGQMDPAQDNAGLMAQFLGALSGQDASDMATQIREKGFAATLLRGLGTEGKGGGMLTMLLEALAPLMNWMFEEEIGPQLRLLAEHGLPAGLGNGPG
jgi:hypothetical protein